MRIPNYEKPNYENFSSFFEQFHSHNLVREGIYFRPLIPVLTFTFTQILDALDPECVEIEKIQAGGKFALSLAFSSDNELLSIGGMDGNIKIFSNSNYQLLHTIEGHAMPIRSITFSPDSQFMMSASDDGHIKGRLESIT